MSIGNTKRQAPDPLHMDTIMDTMKTSILITPALHERLKVEAAVERRSMSSAIEALCWKALEGTGSTRDRVDQMLTNAREAIGQ